MIHPRIRESEAADERDHDDDVTDTDAAEGEAGEPAPEPDRTTFAAIREPIRLRRQATQPQTPDEGVQQRRGSECVGRALSSSEQWEPASLPRNVGAVRCLDPA